MVQPDLPVRVEKAYVEEKKLSKRWWTLSGDEIAQSMWNVVQEITNNQMYLTRRNLFYASLYENRELQGFDASTYTDAGRTSVRSFGVTWNLIKSGIDTLVAKLGTEKPKPFCLTDNANWPKQRRAKLMTQYLEGLFDRMGAWSKGRTAFRDACAIGTGFVKIHNATGQVECDRVLCEEIVVDEIEAVYGEPRNLFQKRFVAKDVAIALWAKDEKGNFDQNKALLISSAATGMGTANIPGNGYTAMVLILEGWHLPSSKPEKGKPSDGKHVIGVSNCKLFEEEWRFEWFPFAGMRYCDRILGYYGSGAAEEVSGIQLEINKMLRTIAIAQHLIAVPQVWIDIANKIPGAKIDNEVGGTKFYTGAPPVFNTPTAMNPEMYQYLETLWNRGFDILGISQLSSQGKKPAGVDAAVALRTLQDVESDRFTTTQQRYEEMYIQLARMAIELEEQLHQKTKDQKVKVTTNKMSKTIDWKKARLDMEDYSIRLWPTNLLPSDPAGKMQKTVEMMQGGLLDKEEGISLMDFPDVEGVTSLKTAARDDIMRIIGNILDEGWYETPEPHMDLQQAKVLAQLSYLKARNDNAPSDKLDLLLSFMEDIQAMLDEMEQGPLALPPGPDQIPPGADALPSGSPQPEPGMDQSAAIAQPEAQPVSDLMPVA